MGATYHPQTVQSVIQIEGESVTLLAATVQRISETEGLIVPAEPDECPVLEPGDKLRITFWEEGALCCWSAEVIEARSSKSNALKVRLCGELRRERRRHTRVSVKVPLAFVIIESEQFKLMGKMGLSCRTRDLSLGGASFSTTLPLRVGDKIITKIDLPEGRITVAGQVVRSELNPTTREVSVGLEFLQSEAEDQRRLQQFLSRFSRLTIPGPDAGGARGTTKNACWKANRQC